MACMMAGMHWVEMTGIEYRVDVEKPRMASVTRGERHMAFHLLLDH